MKITAIAFIISIFIFTQLNAQITPRVGIEIDKNEREYFGLFPKIDNFQSAVLRKENDTSFGFKINYTKDSLTLDTLYVLNLKAISTLNKFIENYEEICVTDDIFSYPLDWILIVKDLIRLRIMYDNPDDEISIFLNSGEYIESSLLYFTDNQLVLWPQDSVYNWESYQKYIRNILFKDIQSVKYKCCLFQEDVYYNLKIDREPNILELTKDTTELILNYTPFRWPEYGYSAILPPELKDLLISNYYEPENNKGQTLDPRQHYNLNSNFKISINKHLSGPAINNFYNYIDPPHSPKYFKDYSFFSIYNILSANLSFSFVNNLYIGFNYSIFSSELKETNMIYPIDNSQINNCFGTTIEYFILKPFNTVDIKNKILFSDLSISVLVGINHLEGFSFIAHNGKTSDSEKIPYSIDSFQNYFARLNVNYHVYCDLTLGLFYETNYLKLPDIYIVHEYGGSHGRWPYELIIENVKKDSYLQHLFGFQVSLFF